MAEPLLSFVKKHWKLIGVAVVVLAIIGALTEKRDSPATTNANQAVTKVETQTPTSTPVATPNPSPTPVGSYEQRLAVASEIRHYLRDEDIPANVVAIDTTLKVYYQVAFIEYAPDTFFKQQGGAGMRRIADAGFEMLVISAQDQNRRTQSKEFPLAQYRTK